MNPMHFSNSRETIKLAISFLLHTSKVDSFTRRFKFNTRTVMESVTSKPSSVMPGIGAAVSVIVHSTAPTMAEPAAGAKPLTPRQTRVTTQHKV